MYSDTQKQGRNTKDQILRALTSENLLIHCMMFLFRMHNRDSLIIAKKNFLELILVR